MGHDNQIDEDSMGRGWSAPDKFVCPDCVADDFLKEKITQNLARRKCDYCGQEGKGYISTPVATIMEHIGPAFHYYFVHPNHADLLVDGGDYVFPPAITADAGLLSINLECHEVLLADIAGSIGTDTLWVRAGGNQNEYLSDEWGRFVRTVKHETRFFFSTLASTGMQFPSQYTPVEMLAEIGRIVMDRGLVRTWPAGTKLFRGRKREADATWLLNAKELGSPPNEKALAQRMNPAGISYFYLATKQKTVLAEVACKPPCQIAMASFTLCRDLRLLDLTPSHFPQLSSIFDQARRTEYESSLFLMDFANKISERVEKDGREHIDYVPSQVVCEYFAKIFQLDDGVPLEGMAYGSAEQPDGTNVVLFPPKGGRGFIELVNFSDPVLLSPEDFSHIGTKPL